MDGTQTFQWSALAKQTKVYIIAAAVLLVIIIGSLIWDDVRVSWQVRTAEKAADVAEAKANQAERDKNAALDLAAKTASKIQIAEEQLSKTEGQRDVQKNDIQRGNQKLSTSRAEYDRAVHERLPTVPSTDALCKQLANAGHPCYPVTDP